MSKASAKPDQPGNAGNRNAIEDAIGVRIKDLPITAEKIYAALRTRSR